LIITEHIPNNTFFPNIDKPSGLGIRLQNGIRMNIGAVIAASTFNFRADQQQHFKPSLA